MGRPKPATDGRAKTGHFEERDLSITVAFRLLPEADGAMANQLKMAEIQAILALAGHGWSGRQIARELGMHRGTVRRYLRLGQGDSKPASAPTGIGVPADSKPASAPTGSTPSADGSEARWPRIWQRWL